MRAVSSSDSKQRHRGERGQVKRVGVFTDPLSLITMSKERDWSMPGPIYFHIPDNTVQIRSNWDTWVAQSEIQLLISAQVTISGS